MRAAEFGARPHRAHGHDPAHGGFDKLTKAQQLEVLNNPANFNGLSKSANASKGSKSFTESTEHQSKGTAVNATFRVKMIQLERQLQSRLQQLSDALARGKSP